MVPFFGFGTGSDFGGIAEGRKIRIFPRSPSQKFSARGFGLFARRFAA
jgi:hypothetical protein